MRTGLFLQFEARWYGVPLNQFTAGKRDEREKACATALEDIRTKNYAEFKKVWEGAPKATDSGNDKDRARDKESSPGAQAQMKDPSFWLDGYHANFNLEHVTMVGEVLVGSHSVCVWDGNIQSGQVVRRAFIVRGGPKSVRVSAVTSGTKLEEVLLNSLEAARKDPSAYKPIFGFHATTLYAVPVEGKGNAGEHPVFLQFDGKAYDYDVSKKAQVPPDDPVIQLYQSGYLAAHADDADALAPMFTPRSATALKDLVQRDKEIEAARLKAGAEKDSDKEKGKGSEPHPGHGFLEPRQVKFVIHGDPVSLIFVLSTSDPSKAQNPSFLSYRYVVKDAASGRLEFANLGSATALDQFLYSDLFDMRIMRGPQPMAKPAVAPAKPKTAS